MDHVAFAIAAHPDDIEFLMAGTLLQLGDAGYQLHYMNLANGCCGTTQHDAQAIAEIRREEARRSAGQLGAVFHDSLCNDLEIFYDRLTLLRLAAVMRQVRPTVVLTHSLSDYMEDHMNTARLAVTAAFARGMPNFPVQPAVPPSDQPVAVYHAQPYTHRDPLGQLVLPELFVDVSHVQLRKTELLACHVSQKRWLDESQGHDSYLETMRQLDAALGDHSGRFAAAEGWRRHLPVGLSSPDFDPLASDLPANRVQHRQR